MLGVKHPFTGSLYEQDGHGNIVVTNADGTRGRFRRNGSWIEGDVREADPQLCNWVGGPQISNHRVTPSPEPAIATG